MSKRRMFSQNIVESDAFLDMPLGTQALYFHLGMNADDDGFVNPKRVMRMVGANDDDLKILIAKRFILQFESGIVVVKHWPTNNFIRSDRYKATAYKSELATLAKNENGDYTESITETVAQPQTIGIPNDIPKVDPSKVKLSKVKLSKDTYSSDNSAQKMSIERVATEEITELLEYWHSRTGMQLANEAGNRKAIAALIRQHGKDNLKKLVDGVVLSHEDQFAPRISDFVSLKRKQNDLLVWGRKNRRSSQVAKI